MLLLKRPRNRSRAGWGLIMVGIAMIAGTSMAAILLTSGTVASKGANLHRHQVRAWYLAEGALEHAKKDMIEAVANFDPVPTTGKVSIDGVTVDYTVTPSGLSTFATDSAGIQTLIDGYQIDSTVVVEGYSATAHRVVNIESTPIFQFAVFYDDDLEIHPGPSMTLGGRVHTNADMYLGSGGTLTMDTNYVRTVGNIYRNRKDDPLKSSGTVEVRRWVENPYDSSEPEEYVTMNSLSQMDSLGVTSVSGYDSAFTEGWDDNEDGDFDDFSDWLPWAPGALEAWSEPDGYSESGHTVMSADHGTSAVVPPSVGSIAMFEEVEGGTGGDYVFDGSTYVLAATPGMGSHDKGYFHESADVSITAHTDGTWTAYDSYGTDISSGLSGVVSVSTIFDARQADGSSAELAVVEIDIAALNDSGHFPSNGLIYAGAYGAGEGTDAKGVVLKNGSEIKAPLTVATENSVFVQGDYNITNKVGAAVIADAVNLLSNSWDGSKSVGTLPTASETTYNVAFITGNHDTIGTAYNGGFENLPRFHEKWSNIPCNLTGSFVNTWTSVHATGLWKYGGDRYKAPSRKWAYDDDFNDIANLPPFTPMVISAVEVVSW